MVDLLRQKSRPYLFSNALAPSVVSLRLLSGLPGGYDSHVFLGPALQVGAALKAFELVMKYQ